MYLYWTKPEAEQCSYSNEYILGCLVSRTMNFYSMKKFGEVDPARAFAKLTHSRLAHFPIPALSSDEEIAKANRIAAAVRTMLTTRSYGGEEDYAIERELRSLWGITGDEGRYINGFFSQLPAGQAVVDLFPEGAPSRVPYPKAV